MPSRKRRASKPLNAHDALGVVQHIYGCALAGDDSLWDTILSDLADLHNVDRASALRIDKRTSGYELLSAVGFELSDLTSSFRRYGIDGDPLYGVIRRLPPYATFVDGQYPYAERVYGSPFNKALREPDNFAKHLVGVLRNDADNCTAVAFWRPLAGPSFTDTERQTLEWLMPHVDQAMEIRQRLQAAAPVAGHLLPPDTLLQDDARHGMVVLDDEGRALLATREASRILATGDVLCLAGNRLTAQDPLLGQRFEEARLNTRKRNGAGDRHGPHILRVPRDSGRLAYEILVAAADHYGKSSLLPPGAATIVVLTDPGAYFRLSAERLRALGLTTAEARLCEALMRTGSFNAAAADISIAPSTARSHIKSVYRKLGISSQVELVQSLASGFDHGP